MNADLHTLLLCRQRQLEWRGMYKKRIDVPAEFRGLSASLPAAAKLTKPEGAS